MVDSPLRQVPAEYDEMSPNTYNPRYTREISTKMRVPNRLSGMFVQREEDDSDRENVPVRKTAEMSVPDKIVVAGQDKHIGLRNENRTFSDLELTTVTTAESYVGLTTPPRILTLEEKPFPIIEDVDEVEPKSTETSFNINGIVTPVHHDQGQGDQLHMAYTPGDSLYISTEDDDQGVLLRKHVAKLTRKVILIEKENQKRGQRELVLYPIVMGYILYKVVSFFFRGR